MAQAPGSSQEDARSHSSRLSREGLQKVDTNVISHTAVAAPMFPHEACALPATPLQTPPADSVHQQLHRILKSRIFSRSKELCRFLQFAVEQKLRNRAVRLKEYLIGVTVFERGENFNPGTDPIVRVQARRLRY